SEARYVGAQVVHHDPGTAFGEKFGVRPTEPAACPSYNRYSPRQRNSFSHLAILPPCSTSRSVTEPSRTHQRRNVQTRDSQVVGMGDRVEIEIVETGEVTGADAVKRKVVGDGRGCDHGVVASSLYLPARGPQRCGHSAERPSCLGVERQRFEVS